MSASEGEAAAASPEAEGHRQGGPPRPSRSPAPGCGGPLEGLGGGPLGGPLRITPTFVELVRLMPTPLRGQKALELYVHSKMTDLGFLPCEEDAAAAPTAAAAATAATSAATAAAGSLVRLPGGEVARVIYTPSSAEGGDGWSCSYTRPEWRVFLPQEQQQQQQQQLVAARRLRLSLGRVGGRAVLRADDDNPHSSAVLLELPHDLAAAADTAAAAAAAQGREATRDPLSEFDAAKLQSLEALLQDHLTPLPQGGPPAASPRQGASPTGAGAPLNPRAGAGAPGALLPSRGPPPTYSGLPPVGADDLRPPLGPPGLGGAPPHLGGPWGSGGPGGGGSLVGPNHPLFGMEEGRGGPPLPPGSRYDPLGPLGTDPAPDHTPILPYEGPGGPGARGPFGGGPPMGPYGRGPPSNPFGNGGAGGGGFFM